MNHRGQRCSTTQFDPNREIQVFRSLHSSQNRGIQVFPKTGILVEKASIHSQKTTTTGIRVHLHVICSYTVTRWSYIVKRSGFPLKKQVAQRQIKRFECSPNREFSSRTLLTYCARAALHWSAVVFYDLLDGTVSPMESLHGEAQRLRTGRASPAGPPRP